MALFCLSTILLVITLAIELESEGPALFRQTREGKKRRLFTMCELGEFPISQNGHGPAVTMIDDCRLSRIRRVLERLEFDALPQFLNVPK